jgi:anti-anti-sigma factor
MLMETINRNEVQNESRQLFRPDGDITAVTAPAVRTQLKGLLDQGARELVVDFANIRVIDSTGIGLLVATHNSLHRIEGSLALINVSDDLHELLKAFRLDKHFSISGDPRLG